MSSSFPVRRQAAILALFTCWLSASATEATIARFTTVLGNFDVRLYDSATPLTVSNFRQYIDSNRYDGTFVHRSIPGFVVQGGGFVLIGNEALHINTYTSPLNEPGISNRRGTIAMAKVPPPVGGPNSATSEWFINLVDNGGAPNNLDTQNGGFTVFGRVVGSGMNVVDSIAALTSYTVNFQNAQLQNVPLRPDPDADPDADLIERLAFVLDINVLNLPAGDYDFNGVVNAADYTVWRMTNGSTTDVAADGNGNGVVDSADYVIWRNLFTAGGGSLVGIVPEPGTGGLSLLAAGLAALVRRRRSK